MQEPPRVVLVPEIHNNTAMVAKRNALVDAARSGQVFLVSEGLVSGHEKDELATLQSLRGGSFTNSREFGMEDEKINAARQSVQSYVKLVRSLSAADHGATLQETLHLVLDLRQNPSLQQAWDKARHSMKGTSLDEAADRIEQLRTLPLGNLVKSNVLAATMADADGLKAAVKRLVNEVKAEIPDLAANTPAGRAYDDYLEHPFDADKEAAFAWDVAVKWRNDSIAKNILKAYNVASQQNEDVFVTIGALHVVDLAGVLHQMAPNVKVATSDIDLSISAIGLAPRSELSALLQNVRYLQDPSQNNPGPLPSKTPPQVPSAGYPSNAPKRPRLGQVGPPSTPPAPAFRPKFSSHQLEQRANSNDPAVAQPAQKELATTGIARLTEDIKDDGNPHFLKKLADSPHQEVAKAARQALASTGIDAIVECMNREGNPFYLKDLADSPHQEVAKAARQALASTGIDAMVEWMKRKGDPHFLKNLAESPHQEVAKAARQALASTGVSAVLEYTQRTGNLFFLKQLAASKYADVAQAASAALATLPSP